MTKEEQILAFIKRRFSQDCNWIDGNCYYFAMILKTRFPELDIYYLPISQHFITGCEEFYYDWNGKIEPSETPLKFDLIQHSDPVLYATIIRDSVM